MKPLPFPRSPLSRVRAPSRLVPAALVPALVLLVAQPIAAAKMVDLGDLPDGSAVVSANGISGNGKVVVGHLFRDWMYLPFRWRADQGASNLEMLSSNSGFADSVSGDGRYIVGSARVVAGDYNNHAYRWDAAGGFTHLGLLAGDISSAARGISNDGSVVVGYSLNTNYIARAFRWTILGMQDLGRLQNGATYAYGVSGDGAVVVGSSKVDGQNHAFRWSAVNGMVDLHTPGSLYSEANATNGDGSVVVGSQSLATRVEAFRWSAATGMQNLGSLGGIVSVASDVNAAGSVVVGTSEIASRDDRAFRWSAATGMVDLGVLSGATVSSAKGVSDDGNIVVGTSGSRAFIWTADAPAMQDFTHLHTSLIRSADTVNHLIDSQNRRLRDLAQQQCLPTVLQTSCVGIGNSAYKGEGDTTGNQNNTHLAGGVRINEQFAVGATTAFGHADLKQASAKQRSAFALGLWAAYQQNPDNLGWGGTASVAKGESDNRIERGVGLSDVQRARAKLDMHSTALRLAVSYGLQVHTSLVTPEIALSHLRATQSGFTERNVALPLTVNSSNSEENYVTLAVRSATPVNSRGILHLSLAVDTLLGDDTAAIQGRSPVPGLSRFKLDSSLDKRRAVPMASAGYSHAINASSTVAGGVQVATSTFQGERPVFGIEVRYRYAF